MIMPYDLDGFPQVRRYDGYRFHADALKLSEKGYAARTKMQHSPWMVPGAGLSVLPD
jgi:hypothetical protein